MNEQEIRTDERTKMFEELVNEIMVNDKQFSVFTDAQWVWLKKEFYKKTHV